MTAKRYLYAVLAVMAACYCMAAPGQESTLKDKLRAAIGEYFANYKPKDTALPGQARALTYSVDAQHKTIRITANTAFAAQPFDQSTVRKIYKRLAKSLPKPYNKYNVEISAAGLTIDQMVPGMRYDERDVPNMWGEVEYDGTPWVSNMSRPNTITHGLQGRHLALWASHGMYYDQSKGRWKWQRPYLYGTTEDLYTQSIVVPLLIPMLENAGANVFTPRERDYQTNEYIIDNDSQRQPYYTESEQASRWQSAPERGFAQHSGAYSADENPFVAGTARMAKTTQKASRVSEASYQPNFAESGRYAVYVSYQTVDGSVDDAEYLVMHKGEITTLRVNQQMGGSTWVYLGTYDFDKGCSEYNRVVVTNHSASRGYVTTDAVRFGGGMGNMARGGSVSGMPRCLEGARYSAQWSGAPYRIYSTKGGTDDYGDDINVRSLMTNWLGGGSVYMPSVDGKRVPIELSLAVHSDAGYSLGHDIIGTLAICTTNFNGGRLNCGLSRMMSKDLADSLLTGITRDLRLKYRSWTRRDLYDRNYSETRLPEVPSAIVEMLSHQNFADMRYGQDPNFKFTLARSIYKTLLRYINHQHGRPYVVQPLAPSNFRVEIVGKNRVQLSWSPVIDESEPTAVPTSYNVYTAIGTGDFDNGQAIRTTSCTLDVEPGMLYHFRVTAVNRGGESFPTQVLSAYCAGSAGKTVLIVDGFDRLSSPAIVDTDTQQGFDLGADAGVGFGLTTCWNGKQQCFDRSHTGVEGPGGLGYSGNEMAGHFFMGNDFAQVMTHADAIAATAKYSVASCSREAMESGAVSLKDYDCVDIMLGLQKNDGHSLRYYKTLTPTMRTLLADYTARGGRLLISGAYIGQDLPRIEERQFLANVLKATYQNSNTDGTETLSGLGLNFDIYRSLCKQHYAAPSVDVMQSVGPAYCAMQYASGESAAVAYDGTDYKAMTLGFPFECIKSLQQRRAIMSGLLQFLLR